MRSAYRIYIDLSRMFSDMQKSYDRTWSKVNSLTARVEEFWNENRVLRERLKDFNRVEGWRRDAFEMIAQREESLEEAQRILKREQKRKIDRRER